MELNQMLLVQGFEPYCCTSTDSEFVVGCYRLGGGAFVPSAGTSSLPHPSPPPTQVCLTISSQKYIILYTLVIQITSLLTI